MWSDRFRRPIGFYPIGFADDTFRSDRSRSESFRGDGFQPDKLCLCSASLQYPLATYCLLSSCCSINHYHGTKINKNTTPIAVVKMHGTHSPFLSLSLSFTVFTVLLHKISHSSPKKTKAQNIFTHPLQWTQTALKLFFLHCSKKIPA